jgi:hypothetical protein
MSSTALPHPQCVLEVSVHTYCSMITIMSTNPSPVLPPDLGSVRTDKRSCELTRVSATWRTSQGNWWVKLESGGLENLAPGNQWGGVGEFAYRILGLLFWTEAQFQNLWPLSTLPDNPNCSNGSDLTKQNKKRKLYGEEATTLSFTIILKL